MDYKGSKLLCQEFIANSTKDSDLQSSQIFKAQYNGPLHVAHRLGSMLDLSLSSKLLISMEFKGWDISYRLLGRSRPHLILPQSQTRS